MLSKKTLLYSSPLVLLLVVSLHSIYIYFFMSLEVYLLFTYLYLYIPVVVSFISLRFLMRMSISKEIRPQKINSFRIIIPAHNEALVIQKLLDSIQKQEYPTTKFETWVIADNCSDKTAQIAQNYEFVKCFERNTNAPSSKGEALQFASEQLKRSANEGYIVLIDADCQLDAYFLSEVNKKLNETNCSTVIQTFRYVNNKSSYMISTLDSASEAIRQWIFLGSRKMLGLSSYILGSGVVFESSLFIRLTSENNGGIVEDKQWNAQLLDERIKIDWCPSAKLQYQVVENNKDFQVQRKRWISGQIALAKKYFIPMFFKGITKGNPSQVDFSFSLIQMPRSAILMLTFIFILLSGLTSLTLFPFYVYCLLFVSLICYGFLGLLLIKAEAKYYFQMLLGSSIIIGLTRSTISSLIRKKERKWTPTSRVTKRHKVNS